MEIVIAHGADISTESGGTDRITAFVNGLAREGHQVTLVCPPPHGKVPRFPEEISLELARPNRSSIASQPVRGLSVSIKAKRIAEKKDAILQFEHSSLAGIGAIIGCRNYILDMHDLVFPSPLYSDLPLESLFRQAIKQIEWRGIKHAAAIVVVSDFMEQLVREEWPVPSDKFITIANGYCEETITQYRTTETQPGRVVFLGTLHPKLDLQAFKNIATLSEVTELIVIGDGPMREQLEELGNQHESLLIRGRLPDNEAFSLVASAEVAINPQNPSRLQQASSPVKLYHYSALGVPMVVSEGPEVVSELAKKDAARPVTAHGSFAEAVQELLTDPTQRKRLGKRAQQLSEEFTWDSRTSSLLDFYSREVLHDETTIFPKQ